MAYPYPYPAVPVPVVPVAGYPYVAAAAAGYAYPTVATAPPPPVPAPAPASTSIPVVTAPPHVYGKHLHQAEKARRIAEATRARAEEEAEAKAHPEDILEMSLTNSFFNMPEPMAQNIIKSDYFNSLYEIIEFNDIIDEIYNRVEHLEPYILGNSRIPSSAFCLLYKLFIHKLTKSKLKILLRHNDSPYIRGMGLLYIRHVGKAEHLWDWFSRTFDDDEVFKPGGEDVKMTVGEYAQKLLTEPTYYGITIRRLPVPEVRKWQVKLIAREKRLALAAQNEANRDLFYEGCVCEAQYTEDDIWYEAKIISVQDNGNFWVKYTEYGNEEEVDIGRVKLKASDKEKERDKEKDSKRSARSRSRSRSRDRDRDRDRDRGRRRSRSRSPRKRSSRSRSRSRETPEDTMSEVLRRERERSVAQGKNYAQRPTSYKTALSVKLSTSTTRKRSRSPPPVSYRRHGSPPRDRAPSPPRKSEMSAEARQRYEALKQKYGDASSSKKPKDSNPDYE